MLGITRSVVASAVIVGTVALSLGSAFGLSVLIWQHILHMPLHWLVLPMAIIVMLAVGSDYNLLLIARFQEEIRAGLKTGMIRAMAGTAEWSPSPDWCLPSPWARWWPAIYASSAKSAPRS